MSGYKLGTSYGVGRLRSTKHWVKVDELAAIPVSELINRYRVLEVPILDIFNEEWTLNLNEVINSVKYYRGDLTQWLSELPDGYKLPLTEFYPTLETTNATYIPGLSTISNVRLAERNSHPLHDAPLDYLRDIVVEVPGTDMQYMSKYTLWSVGGYYVQSEFDSGWIRLFGGGSIAAAGEDISFGCLNFQGIGKVDTISITEDMIHLIDDSLELTSRVHINTKVPVGDKTVGLVLGGYLHLLDGAVTVTGSNNISLMLDSMSIEKRLLQSQDALELDYMKGIGDGILVSTIRTKENLTKYLTCPHSFLVLIDNVNMFMDEVPLDHANVPGICNAVHTQPKGHLVDRWGKNVDYWYTQELGLHCFTYKERTLPNYSYTDGKWREQTRINDSRVLKCTAEVNRPRMYVYKARV